MNKKKNQMLLTPKETYAGFLTFSISMKKVLFLILGIFLVGALAKNFKVLIAEDFCIENGNCLSDVLGLNASSLHGTRGKNG
jgi:hypothetical protein